jgi:hypothetical protein
MKSSIDERLERLERARENERLDKLVAETKRQETIERQSIKAERKLRRLAAEGRRQVRWHRAYVVANKAQPRDCTCILCRPDRWVGVDLTLAPAYSGADRLKYRQR